MVTRIKFDKRDLSIESIKVDSMILSIRAFSQVEALNKKKSAYVYPAVIYKIG